MADSGYGVGVSAFGNSQIVLVVVGRAYIRVWEQNVLDEIKRLSASLTPGTTISIMSPEYDVLWDGRVTA
jgi:hypothetical protein